MKRLVTLSLVLLLSAGGLMAQKIKGKAPRAERFLNQEKFEVAKDEIDAAMKDEKQASKSKTYMVRGKIYQQLAVLEDEQWQANKDEYIKIAGESYNKFLEMEGENSFASIEALENQNNLWGVFVNDGGEAYQDGDYEGSYNNFRRALLVKPEDSITLFYAGVAAQQIDEIEKALEHFVKMIDLDVADEDVYTSVVYFKRARLKDNEGALKYLEKAMKKFPDNGDLRKEYINILMAMDKIDEAKEKIKEEIDNEPENELLHLTYAIIHDNYGSELYSKKEVDKAIENFEVAKKSYLRVIELDPDNYVANFNLGAIHTNIAKQYYDEARDMDMKEYRKRGDEVVKQGDDVLAKGVPYMKKATEIKPDDLDALQALQQMYTQLKMMDEAEKVLQQIESIEG